jgi:hypothetical protein
MALAADAGRYAACYPHRGTIMTEQIKEALDIYVAQTGIINTLWNIFLAASVAILGYVYKDRTLMDDWKIKLGLTIGFPLFAFGNSTAILRAQKILVAATNYLNNVPDTGDSSFNQVLKSHTAPSVERICWSHFVFTLLVLIAMWLPNIAKVIASRKRERLGA